MLLARAYCICRLGALRGRRFDWRLLIQLKAVRSVVGVQVVASGWMTAKDRHRYNRLLFQS